MQQAHSILVELTNTTRLHISDSAQSQAERTVAGGRLPYTQTTKTRVPITSTSEGEEKQSMYSVPIINSNLLRGRIRRTIAAKIMDSLRDRGEGISVDLIHLLTTLATSGSPSSSKNVHNAMLAKDPVKFFNSSASAPTNEECSSSDFRTDYLVRMTSDPFSALFGGGPNMWPSRLVTPDLLPNLTVLQQPYLINNKYAHLFERPPMTVYPSELMEYVGSVRNDDVFKNNEHVDPASEDLQTWVKIEISNTGKDEDVSKSNLRNMMTLQVVRPGTSFIGELSVKNEDVSESIFDVMKGLVLIAIKDLEDQQLGGVVRNGWGKVNLSIAQGDDDACIQKANEYINNVTVSDLMEAYGVALR